MYISTVLLLICLLAGQTSGQERLITPADSMRKAVADSGAAAEVVLEDIHIEAVIEKPAVTLIPKRVVPDVGEPPVLLRSFDQELKARPRFLDELGEDPKMDDRLDKAKKGIAKQKK
jgi:hypothetical protein